MTGLHLAQYRIDAELGRGGMGIVYRATDTKLDRTVAVKVLPPHALASDEDRARFYREAKAAAQLHHPNIATVFQVDEAEVEGSQRPFIAMEFIDGESLSEHIAKGPLKLEEAVSIATQIAEALKAAHAKEIVHRDIKSQNVMLTKDGVAKVLDFGLAKTAASTKLTRQGSTMGTVAYMSPEQARGDEVDGRTDLWALGVTLYEMVTGRLPFAADYEQAALYAILNQDPEPPTAIRTGVPMDLERIIFRALQKDPGRRYQTASDFASELQALDLQTGTGSTTRITTTRASARPKTPRRAGAVALPWLVALATLALGLAAGWWIRGPTEPSEREPIVFDSGIADSDVSGPPAIDPAGRTVAIVSEESPNTSFLIRDLDKVETRTLEIPHALTGSYNFSPDGRWLAVPTEAGIGRLSIRDGAFELWSDSIVAVNAAWLDDQTIIAHQLYDTLFYAVRGLGKPVERIDTDGQFYVAHPYRIPDSDLLLYYRYPDPDRMARGTLMTRDLSSGDETEVATNGQKGRYSPAGYVTFYRDGDVYAARFDPRSRHVGPSFLVLSGVLATDFQVCYDLAPSGVAVYHAGSGDALFSRNLAFMRRGERSVLPIAWDGAVSSPRLSPDGSSVLVHVLDPVTDDDVWRVDLERAVPQRLTFDPGETEYPIWSPDGDAIYYSSMEREDLNYVLRMNANDPSDRDTLWTGTSHVHVDAVSPDERFVVLDWWQELRDRFSDVMVLDLETGTTRPLIQTRYDEGLAALSPDGHWLAYQSNETGRYEVYLRRFPDMTSPQRVTTEGGSRPEWSRDGSTLYYFQGGSVYRVPINASGRPGTPELHESVGVRAVVWDRTFDVAEDGTVFFVEEGGTVEFAAGRIVLGFDTALRTQDPEAGPRD